MPAPRCTTAYKGLMEGMGQTCHLNRVKVGLYWENTARKKPARLEAQEQGLRTKLDHWREPSVGADMDVIWQDLEGDGQHNV